jgi:tRNA-dihydrouridine synthase
VRETRLPVIANGDIRTAAQGERVLRETGAAGLMLGRGAIADPLLFQRLRGRVPAAPGADERRTELCRYLQAMLESYRRLFCGDMQVLAKLKEIVSHIDVPGMEKTVKELRRAKTLAAFEGVLKTLGGC